MRVAPNKLGNWMRGEHYPDPLFLTRFCNAYGITTDWIYRGVVPGVDAGVAAYLRAVATESAAEP